MKICDLITELRKGVQYERYGNMEPDIWYANELMEEAALKLENLFNEMENEHENYRQERE
jgi:hypothetical protein